MKTSKFFISTLKEVPAEAEIVEPSADAARRPHPAPRCRHLHLAAARPARGAQGRGHRARGDEPRRRARARRCRRCSPPSCGRNPAAGRQYGPELLRFKDRHERDFCIRPDLRGGDHRHRAQRAEELPPAAGALLPDPDQVPRREPAALRRHARARIRDEGRLLLPRRLRRPASASTATCTTPTRASSRAWGCKFRAVAADTGAIGGTGSHEFHVLADSGEDAIAFCPQSDYAANVELAEALRARRSARADRRSMEKVADARQDDLRGGGRSCSKIAARSRPSRPIAVMHDGRSCHLLLRARRPRAERDQGAARCIGGRSASPREAEIERALRLPSRATSARSAPRRQGRRRPHGRAR